MPTQQQREGAKELPKEPPKERVKRGVVRAPLRSSLGCPAPTQSNSVYGQIDLSATLTMTATGTFTSLSEQTTPFSWSRILW